MYNKGWRVCRPINRANCAASKEQLPERRTVQMNKMIKLPGLIINAYQIRSIQPGMEADFFGGNRVYMIVFKMIDGTKEVFRTRSKEGFDEAYEYTVSCLGEE